MKILIVDDQPMNRLLLREIVAADGHQTVEASNGREALRAVDKDAPDIVLLDIMMPEMDGVETCREIRHKHSLSDLPILFITALTDDENLVRGFQAGGNDYITKPLNAAGVRARIQSHVRLLEATRAAVHAREEALAANRLKTIGIFSAGVAHSINTLATSILGRAEVLRSEASTRDDFPAEKLSALIVQSAKRAIELGESLVSIVDPDKQDHCVNVEDLVHATAALVHSTTSCVVNYQVEMDRDLPAIGISSLALSHILLELLDTSISNIRERGTIALRVTYDRDASGERPGMVSFSLTDTGVELSADASAMLQDSLPVAPGNSLSSDIGLAGVIDQIQRVNGEINLISSDSSGTRIEFRLPAVYTPNDLDFGFSHDGNDR